MKGSASPRPGPSSFWASAGRARRLLWAATHSRYGASALPEESDSARALSGGGVDVVRDGGTADASHLREDGPRAGDQHRPGERRTGASGRPPHPGPDAHRRARGARPDDGEAQRDALPRAGQRPDRGGRPAPDRRRRRRLTADGRRAAGSRLAAAGQERKREEAGRPDLSLSGPRHARRPVHPRRRLVVGDQVRVHRRRRHADDAVRGQVRHHPDRR